MRHVTLPALLLPLTLATLSAQSLVGNLVTNAGGNPWSGIDEFAVLGNRAVFAANSQFGYEPWGTDGTPAGTFMLADLMPAGSSNPLDLRVLGGFVVFTADVPGYGRELWRTDGTSAGTMLLKDTRPGAVAGNPRYFAELGGYLYFAANDGVAGEELWRSDGTTAGTVMVFDVRTGNGSSSPHQLTAVGNRLLAELYEEVCRGADEFLRIRKGVDLRRSWHLSTARATCRAGPFLCGGLPTRGLGWREERHETADGAHGIGSECDPDGRALVRLQRLKITDGLGLGQCAERVELFRDRDIRLHRIDQFEKESAVRAAFVKLSGGMQIAGSIPCRGGYTMSHHDGFAQCP
jgi:ELWxxDGT repeat protein